MLLIKFLTAYADASLYLAKYELQPWESKCFKSLGNEILYQMECQVGPKYPVESNVSGYHSRKKHDERMERLKESMKANTTYFSYGDYPWDIVSLTSGISALNANTSISTLF